MLRRSLGFPFDFPFDFAQDSRDKFRRALTNTMRAARVRERAGRGADATTEHRQECLCHEEPARCRRYKGGVCDTPLRKRS